jgi:hypothetical protein
MDDYRSYFEEEETPTRKPANRWWGGLIFGLVLGGVAGFLIGGGNLGGFIEEMQNGFASEGVIVVFTIIVFIGVAMLKSIGLRRSRGENAQTVRMVILMMLVAMTLAFGVIFFAGG